VLCNFRNLSRSRKLVSQMMAWTRGAALPRAAGLSSAGIREPSRGRGRSASPPPVQLANSVLPQGDAQESLSCRKQFPGTTNARAKDVAPRSGVARDRGLMDRPALSPVLDMQSRAPSVVPPWLSKEHVSPTFKAALRSQSAERSEQKVQKVEAQQACQLFGVPPLELYGQRGIGKSAPSPQPVSGLPVEAAGDLRRYRSLPPELFRFEALSQKSWEEEHKVGTAGLSSGFLPRQEAIPEERQASHTPSVQSRPVRPPMVKAATVRKTCHDLRSELRDSLELWPATVTRRTLPGRRPVFWPPTRSALALESTGLSQPVKPMVHDPHSAPTSAGVSRRSSFGAA